MGEFYRKTLPNSIVLVRFIVESCALYWNPGTVVAAISRKNRHAFGTAVCLLSLLYIICKELCEFIHLFIRTNGYPQIIVYTWFVKISDIYMGILRSLEYLLCRNILMRCKYKVCRLRKACKIKWLYSFHESLSRGDHL